MILSLAQIEIFTFILARIAGVFIQAPVFSSRSFNAAGKIAFAVWLTILLWFIVPASPLLPNSVLLYVITLVAEVALGYLIGLICHFFFIAIQAAGELMDLQMGLSVATALDPVFGSVISIIGRLTFFVALVVFLALDGHHLLLTAWYNSFTLIPAGKIANFANQSLFLQLTSVSGSLWLTAVKLSAPVLLLIFLSDFSFGIVSRVAPQVNVFMLGFQVKPILGLFGLSMTLPFIVRYIGKTIELVGIELIKLFSYLR